MAAQADRQFESSVSDVCATVVCGFNRFGRPINMRIAAKLAETMNGSVNADHQQAHRHSRRCRQIFAAAPPVSTRAGTRRTMLANDVNLTIFGGGAANEPPARLNTEHKPTMMPRPRRPAPAASGAGAEAASREMHSRAAAMALRGI